MEHKMNQMLLLILSFSFVLLNPTADAVCAPRHSAGQFLPPTPAPAPAQTQTSTPTPTPTQQPKSTPTPPPPSPPTQQATSPPPPTPTPSPPAPQATPPPPTPVSSPPPPTPQSPPPPAPVSSPPPPTPVSTPTPSPPTPVSTPPPPTPVSTPATPPPQAATSAPPPQAATVGPVGDVTLPAAIAAKLNTACQMTSYLDICISTMTPYLAGVTSLDDTMVILNASIQVAINETKSIKAVAAGLEKQAAGNPQILDAIHACQDDFDDVLEEIQTAVEAIPSKDYGTFTTYLSSAIGGFSDCDDEFRAINPLRMQNERARHIIDNCLAFAENVQWS